MVPAVPARIVSRIWCSRPVTVLPPAVVSPTWATAGWPAPPEPLPDASCLQGRKPSGRQTGLYREPGRNPRAERLGRAIRRVAVTESSLPRRA
jgi:hypothetical protein